MKALIILSILFTTSISSANFNAAAFARGMQQMNNYHHNYRMQRKAENEGSSMGRARNPNSGCDMNCMQMLQMQRQMYGQ